MRATFFGYTEWYLIMTNRKYIGIIIEKILLFYKRFSGFENIWRHCVKRNNPMAIAFPGLAVYNK